MNSTSYNDEHFEGTKFGTAASIGRHHITATCNVSWIRIFDRESGRGILCDDLHDKDNEDDDADNEIVGDLLISTSFYGHALCVWHM